MDWGSKFAIVVIILLIMGMPFFVGDIVYNKQVNNCAGSAQCESAAWNDYLTLIIIFGSVWLAVVILMVVRNVADHV